MTDILSRAEAGEYVAPSVMREELKAFRLSKQQERFGTESAIDAQRTSHNDSKFWVNATESDAFSAVVEFVSVLMQGLSEDDFTRVRDIVTSDTVLSDPQLAKNLERAFGLAMQDCALVNVPRKF